MDAGTGSSGGLRHCLRFTLTSALLGAVVGFLISYFFPPKYTSQSTILVERQKIPESMVQPVVSEDWTARIAIMQQQVLSQTQLLPIVHNVYPNKSSEQMSEIVDDIRANMTVEPVISDLSLIDGEKRLGQNSPVPGFTVSFTAAGAREAQQICNELTSLMVTENLKEIQAAVSGTRDVLGRAIEEGGNNLRDLGSKLANLKKLGRRESASPDSEEQQKLLTIEYDSAKKTYQDLLAKKSAVDLTITMNGMSQGERMFPLNPADLPDNPTFPNRLLFAGAGLATGLILGLGITLWTRLRRKFVRADGETVKPLQNATPGLPPTAPEAS